MFGLGGGEILLISVFALLFIGPKKLPELARGLGRSLKEFQKGKSEFSLDADSPPRTNSPPKRKNTTNTRIEPMRERIALSLMALALPSWFHGPRAQEMASCTFPNCQQEKRLFEAIARVSSNHDEFQEIRDDILEALRLGANINGRNERGDTPLCATSRFNGRPLFMELLISRGAYTSLGCGPQNETPLHLVTVYQNPDAIAPLMMGGRSNPNRPDALGNRPLHNLALAYGWDGEIKFIMAHLLATGRLEVDAQNHLGVTPLHLAVESGNRTAVAILLMAGAKAHIPDGKGQSPLELAREREDDLIVSTLESTWPWLQLNDLVTLLVRNEDIPGL